MPYRDAAKHRMLNHLAGRPESGGPITQASLHTAYPPSDANEIAGGSPAYARKALVFTNAGVEVAGRIDHESVVFDVPASTVTAVAYRAADGTIMADVDTPEVVYATQDTHELTNASYMGIT